MSEHLHWTVLTLEYDAASRARMIERSLRRELGQIDNARSTTELVRDGPQIELTIDATDLVALRAAVNTWLSLASVAERTAETIDF